LLKLVPDDEQEKDLAYGKVITQIYIKEQHADAANAQAALNS
jgi:hypothetical protein